MGISPFLDQNIIGLYWTILKLKLRTFFVHKILNKKGHEKGHKSVFIKVR